MSKYDIHKWKDEELNDMLMERWGYRKKAINEAEKAKLKNPDKADLDKDGELSSYEKRRGAAIEKSMAGDDSEDELDEAADMSSAGGVPMVPAGDIEGMAHAAIAAIVQLASEAGIELEITGETVGDEDMEDMDGAPDMDDDGDEAGEQDLMSPEDL